MNIKNSSKAIYQDKGQGFTDRMRLAVDEVKNRSSVLEIGVGWGELARNIGKHKNIKLHAVDVAETALKSVEEYLEDSELVDISSKKMKFDDDFFDSVICLEVLSIYRILIML